MWHNSFQNKCLPFVYLIYSFDLIFWHNKVRIASRLFSTKVLIKDTFKCKYFVVVEKYLEAYQNFFKKVWAIALPYFFITNIFLPRLSKNCAKLVFFSSPVVPIKDIWKCNYFLAVANYLIPYQILYNILYRIISILYHIMIPLKINLSYFVPQLVILN